MNITNKLPTTIDAVVFDFDGVFTDNAVYLSEEGIEMVRCDRGDGWGIGNLHKAGILMAVMSSEVNPVVAKRCEKLNLECFHKLESSKYDCFKNWCEKHQLKPENVIFIGNDENDIGCLQAAGCGVIPADAHASTLPHADIILTRNGGHGAVRELCDLILSKNNTRLKTL
ncbi:MAG: KdsC family phosphatase [Pontiellaceae bacterium]